MQAMDAALDALRRVQFGVADVVRGAQGDALETYGLGPSECGYQVVASGSHWRLRDYTDQAASRTLLIVAAPIKRPYIWDLSPAVSAIRYCLRARLHVYLLEWMPASRSIGNNGLDDYAQAISECVAQITRKSQGTKLLPHRSFTRRHGCSHICILRTSLHSRPRARRSAALF